MEYLLVTQFGWVDNSFGNSGSTNKVSILELGRVALLILKILRLNYS